MAIDADRDALHALVDALPPERLAEAKAALSQLNVPDDDEPLTDQDLTAILEGREEYRRGETISGNAIRAEFGF
ncbi:MAG: hypothetical protein AB7P40_14240 [Chloroflexota bacterium]